jgi:hypothetical protein
MESLDRAEEDAEIDRLKAEIERLTTEPEEVPD